jgi:heat-inducible transcriptional repressor
MTTGTMLDERKSAILRAVVEEYIETAQPVGSAAVARSARMNVSSATIRNDMAHLETEGFLHQPHTSAGRVPTEKGYRYFVDSIGPATLGVPEEYEVSQFFRRVHGEIEQLMRETASLLTNLTHYAAVVVDRSEDAAIVRSVHLVSLAPRLLLAVTVLANGVVEKHTLELADELDDADRARLMAVVSGAVEGRTLTDPRPLEPTGSPELDRLAEVLRATVCQLGPEHDRVYVEGASRVAAAFDAVDPVKRVLTILEQQLVVVSLIADVLDRGLNVAIGTETGVEPLRDCSVVVAPYDIGGDQAGSIAVLGPTRMNYQQAMAAVAVVSRQLGHRLSEG